jgi:hypothetical protein
MYVSAGAAALHDTEAEGGPQNKKNPEKLKKENPEKIYWKNLSLNKNSIQSNGV